MLFAFSRDRAVPGHQLWSVAEHEEGACERRHGDRGARGDSSRCPRLVEVDINGAPVPVAFFAVVSIGVVGLYLCFAGADLLPVEGGRLVPAQGSWNLRSHRKWMAPVAIIEIIITSIVAHVPDVVGRRSRGTPVSSSGNSSTTPRCPGRRRADPAVDLLARVGEELVHRADQARSDETGVSSWRAFRSLSA